MNAERTLLSALLDGFIRVLNIEPRDSHGFPTHSYQFEFRDCGCGGYCPCHTGVQIAAVPCPPDCPFIGDHFDGCHRCDCLWKRRGIRTCETLGVKS